MITEVPVDNIRRIGDLVNITGDENVYSSSGDWGQYHSYDGTIHHSYFLDTRMMLLFLQVMKRKKGCMDEVTAVIFTAMDKNSKEMEITLRRFDYTQLVEIITLIMGILKENGKTPEEINFEPEVFHSSVNKQETIRGVLLQVVSVVDTISDDIVGCNFDGGFLSPAEVISKARDAKKRMRRAHNYLGKIKKNLPPDADYDGCRKAIATMMTIFSTGTPRRKRITPRK